LAPGGGLILAGYRHQEGDGFVVAGHSGAASRGGSNAKVGVG